HRHDRDIQITIDARRRLEVVVQGDDCVAEALAKMIYFANQRKGYAADSKAREDVQNVLARRGGTGRADHFRNWLDGGHSEIGGDAPQRRPAEFAAVAEMFNSFKYHSASLQREVSLGMCHS